MTQPPPPPPPMQPVAPPPPLNPQDEKTWSVLLHLSGMLSGFVGPLIGYLVLKDRGPFIRHHATQALNFQLSLLIYSLGIVVIALVTVGIGSILVIPFTVVLLIFVITAAVQANAGQFYRYPLTIGFLS